MDKKRVIFLGTPDFSIPSLEGLYNDEDINLLFCITKEDKIQNRGQKLISPIIKTFCDEHNIKCFQPHKLSTDKELISYMKESKPDFLVVVAYGQILSKEVLDIPSRCSINAHASLLPKYRGSAPIQYAILNGDKTTGITTMKMNEGLDTGDILEMEEIDIKEKETSNELFDELKYKARDLLLHTIKNYDNIIPKKQNEEEATYVKIINKEDGFIDLPNENAIDIERKIRAFGDSIGTYVFINDKKIKIYSADVIDNVDLSNAKEISKNIFCSNKNIIMITKNKYLNVNILKPESKNKMTAKDFINGLGGK